MVKWEGIRSSLGSMYRAKVPGGWLVIVERDAPSLIFYPDPDHEWDGSSLP